MTIAVESTAVRLRGITNRCELFAKAAHIQVGFEICHTAVSPALYGIREIDEFLRRVDIERRIGYRVDGAAEILVNPVNTVRQIVAHNLQLCLVRTTGCYVLVNGLVQNRPADEIQLL